jgi:DNA-binding transcriptional regulator YiaG
MERKTQTGPSAVARKCYDCGGVMEGTRGSNYKYTECGLDSVNLVNILVFHCKNPHCGAVVPEIPAFSELHRTIAFSLIQKESLLIGDEIKFLRKMCGLNGVKLAELLGMHKTTLSNWENGKKDISKKSDIALRLLAFSAIMQDSAKENHLLPKVAEVAKRLSEVDLYSLLQRVKEIVSGPKRVTIDPSKLSEFGKLDIPDPVGMVQ